jgi:hypothetical protein
MSVKCEGCEVYAATQVSEFQMRMLNSLHSSGDGWVWWCNDCTKKGLQVEAGRRFWAEYAAKRASQRAVIEGVAATLGATVESIEDVGHE